ncbi:MAG: DUF721 domain-containing protein [Actinobacteria bacterium]|nr:DUF721 domain-containing protein [Actinomycetota bacterium]
MTEERETRDIGETLQELLLSEGMEDLRELVRIREVWSELVGEKVAFESKPYRLEGERLYVGVKSHAWVQELHYRKEEIKSAIREKAGVEIGEIIIKILNLK